LEKTMSPYPLLSALLSYPEADLIDALPEMRMALARDAQSAGALAPLVDHLGATPLIDLQEAYVATFDRTPAHALHLFEHVHGESRARGQALVDLLDEYRRFGFTPIAHELPDYLPLFIEFLGAIAAEGRTDDARRLLGDAIDVIAALGDRLAQARSPYAHAFALLRTLSPVAPRTLADPPPRTMDEALERFGPGADGVEPLAGAACRNERPVRFHPRPA
jgi:nitrate reductase molybdenum cofactor assembly chaperone NarJ/NarW